MTQHLQEPVHSNHYQCLCICIVFPLAAHIFRVNTIIVLCSSKHHNTEMLHKIHVSGLNSSVVLDIFLYFISVFKKENETYHLDDYVTMI